ncbi:MAG: hypothetical protein WCA01_05990, partial [Burkholderiales bacterium]
FLEGAYGAREMRDRALAATRQLAKRQLTWLRSMSLDAALDPFEPGACERWCELALSLARQDRAA